MRELRDQAMIILGDLVGFPTVTSDSNLDLIDYAVDLLESVGADCRITHDETRLKANLFATVGPLIDGGVVLSGHSDVVPADEPDWTGSPFLAMRRDERIYGRGTADMKGFIACALAVATTRPRSELIRPIHVAITFDEEVGCRGVPHLLDDLSVAGLKPSAAIVGEPTEMQIVTAHKGCHEFTTSIIGLEGHGSAPDRAVNAVQYGARYVAKLMELGEALIDRAPPSSPFDPPYSTISVGVLRGGSARNVVAGECVLEWEMRPVNRADADLVRSEMAAFEQELIDEMRTVSSNSSLSTVTEGAVDGLHTEDSSAVRLVGDLLGSRQTGTVAFGTEAGLFQEAGIPAVVCGPGSIDVAHRPDEYIAITQLEHCLEMMSDLRTRLSKE